MKEEPQGSSKALHGAGADSKPTVDGANLKNFRQHGDRTQTSVGPFNRAKDSDLVRLCALVRDARNKNVHMRGVSPYRGASQGSNDSIVSWTELEMGNT